LPLQLSPDPQREPKQVSRSNRAYLVSCSPAAILTLRVLPRQRLQHPLNGYRALPNGIGNSDKHSLRSPLRRQCRPSMRSQPPTPNAPFLRTASCLHRSLPRIPAHPDLYRRSPPGTPVSRSRRRKASHTVGISDRNIRNTIEARRRSTVCCCALAGNHSLTVVAPFGAASVRRCQKNRRTGESAAVPARGPVSFTASGRAASQSHRISQLET
jgi:hypothetical protein